MVTAPPTLRAIAFVFFRIGMLSFGGGLSGWVYREFVELRGWLTNEEFLSGQALSQVLPGPNIANLSVYVGYRLKGSIGAVVAPLALATGPFFVVIGIASAYSLIRTLPYVQTGLEGVAAAAIGLSLLVVIRGVQRRAQRPAALLAFVATFVAVGLLHVSLLLVVVIVGPLSVYAAWPRGTNA